MRILNIYFKNINSLEGETRIDFTEAPFSDTGVFAITGPNGSGKSSILDAITLGLYGETFRFNKPAEYVMTKQTADCFAVVEFSLGAEKYQSSWRVERANGQVTGELQSAVMQLIRLNTGEVLASSPQQVCAQMTNITGMNFRNFTRSILLAQGDFAAFLNALDAERMDILEKIISTDIYADYKKQVVDQAEQAQQGIAQIKQQLDSISLLPPETKEAYEHDLADYQEQYAELREQQINLTQQQTAVKNVTFVQAQINTQKKNIKLAKTDAQHLQEQLERINANQNALVFKEEAAFISDKEQTVTHVKAELSTLKNELVRLKTKLSADQVVGSADKSLDEQQQIISNLKTQLGQLTANCQSEVTLAHSLEIQLEERKSTLASLDAWLSDHAADESLLTHFPELGKLSKLQADLQALFAQQKVFAKQNRDSDEALSANTAALEKERQKLADATVAVEVNEQELATLLERNTLEEIDALRIEQQERVKGFEELKYLATAYQRLSKSGFSFFSFFGGKKEEPELDADALGVEHEELKLEVLREENIKKVLEQKVFHEGLVKKMADSRQHLIDGKPCPLCGALQHPYSKNPPLLGDSQQALIDQQIKIKNLLARTYSVGRQLEEARKQDENKLTNRTRRQRVSSQWLSLCTRLNAFSPDLDIHNLSLMDEILKAENEELKSILELGAVYLTKQNNIVKFKAVIEKSTALIAQLETNIVSITAEIENHVQQQTTFESTLHEHQQEEKELTEQITHQLMLLGEKLPSNDKKGKKEDSLFDRLTARKQEYYSYTFRRNNLIEELELLTAKYTACQAEITYCKEQLDLIGARLPNEENIVLHLVVMEKQKLIADKERLVLEQSTELAQLQQILLAKIATTAFPSLTELNELLALLQRRTEFEQKLTQLNIDIATKTLAMEQSSVELEANLKLAETALSPEELTVQLKQTSNRMDDVQSEVQRLGKLLNEQKRLQQQYLTLQSQLQQQAAEVEPCLAELALLSEENGMVFRRRVQQQLATKLLVQTNAILEKISGRYYLRQLPSEQGLALVVEDTLQANVQRFPKTLSGGESFVVSLALALGLSELANNGRSVDSLFLDEGFGNLDAETLYVIISTLENLHTHGKMVGVISHVDAVQKRFKAQLQVVKKPNGMGMLKKAS